MVQFRAPMSPPYWLNPAYQPPYRYHPSAAQHTRPFHPGFGLEIYPTAFRTPPTRTPIATQPFATLWQTQSHGLNLPALTAFAQQYAQHQKQANPLHIPPKKGAKVGAVALAALGLVVHGWRGLLPGGLTGAGAGWLITRALSESHHHKQ